jgi:hypothetical protein
LAKALRDPGGLDPICPPVFLGSNDISVDKCSASAQYRNVPESTATTAATESEINQHECSSSPTRKVFVRKTWLTPIFIVLVCGPLLGFSDSTTLDLTGKWIGTFHVLPQGGGPREDKAVLILKQQGGVVTGTLGPAESSQMPFRRGRITGNALRIEMQGNRVVFILTLDGDKLTGEIRDADHEGKILAHVDLKRG